MGRMEILSPAGGPQQLAAAVRSGADAVYLGAGAFNARAKAENFGTDLTGTVSYCHARGVKVHVTVNTLVTDRELKDVARVCDGVAQSGADCVIVQDLAVYRYLRSAWPKLELSASTQMAVHNADGARQLEDMGFSTIVLARELTLEEMRAVADSVRCRCEAFLHGAHCMSLSGACYLSVMLGGRSGNRGLCAQPCRLDFRCGGRDYALSLKDMSLISHIREMADAGVSCFKIEGRMKRPEYVAAVTDACVRARDGLPYDEGLLRDVFSRGGFTDGYLMGKRDGRMFGRRTQEDAQKSEGVLSQVRELYRGERPRVQYDAALTLRCGEPSRLTVSDGENEISCLGDEPSAPRTRGTRQEDCERALSKTGGTPFLLRSASLDNGDDLALPPSALNALRRSALDALLAEREKPRPLSGNPYVPESGEPHAPSEAPALMAYCRTLRQALACRDLSTVFLPADLIRPEDAESFGGDLGCALPPVCFPQDEPMMRKSAERCAQLGVKLALCDNLYAIRAAKEHGLTPVGGFALNILNSVSLEEYEKLGLSLAFLSFELPLAQAKRLTGALPRGVAAYGRLPLMRMRSCPARGVKGCGACGGDQAVTDRMGVSFPLLCEDRRYSTLLNSVPLDICGRDVRGFDAYMLYFTLETEAECREVIRRFREGERSAAPHTTGLAFRDLP